MFMVNIFEIKAKLSEYVDRAIAGERVLICRHNKPVAELRAVGEARTEPRPIGPLPGRPTFDIGPEFFEPMSEAELEHWEAVTGSEDVLAIQRPAESTKTTRKFRAAESTEPFQPPRRRRGTKRRS